MTFQAVWKMQYSWKRKEKRKKQLKVLSYQTCINVTMYEAMADMSLSSDHLCLKSHNFWTTLPSNSGASRTFHTIHSHCVVTVYSQRKTSLLIKGDPLRLCSLACRNMVGLEYVLLHHQEPILFVIRKQRRQSAQRGNYCRLCNRPSVPARAVVMLPSARYWGLSSTRPLKISVDCEHNMRGVNRGTS